MQRLEHLVKKQAENERQSQDGRLEKFSCVLLQNFVIAECVQTFLTAKMRVPEKLHL